MYVHTRALRSAGLNMWVYRGPIAAKKRPGERRIVALGGSTTFGYGLRWHEAFPAQLETALRRASPDGPPVSVVNLGFNTQGAYSFRFALEDYRSLQYDLAILYEGYNDMSDEVNFYVGRRDSPVFRLTGYYPILPDYMNEKAMLLRSGGNLEAAYWGKTVFKPGLAARATAGTLEIAKGIGDTLHTQLDRVAQSSVVRRDPTQVVD